MIYETLYCRLPTNWLSDPSQCWFEWQTLISGILAVVAAGVTVVYLKKQISQSDEHEQSRLNRRFNAARATLPLTLSGLCEYAAGMMRELSLIRSAFNYVGNDKMPPRFNTPPPPIELVSSLQEMIEATNRDNVVGIISEIIGEMQVLSARVSALNDRTRSQHGVGLAQNVDEYIVQAASIYALATSLFGFARREDEIGPTEVNWDGAIIGLHLADIREDQFPDLFGVIERRGARGKAIWQFNHDR